MRLLRKLRGIYGLSHLLFNEKKLTTRRCAGLTKPVSCDRRRPMSEDLGRLNSCDTRHTVVGEIT